MEQQEKSSNIIPCYEYVYDGSFPRPKLWMHFLGKAKAIAVKDGTVPQTFRQAGTERIIDRTIMAWSDNLGSYGMGGCGFFGLKLAETNHYPSEWFVLLFWGAANWLLLDNNWMSAHLNLYHIQKPLHSDFQDEKWDYVTDKLVDTTVNDVIITSNSITFELRKPNEKHVLELPADLSRLPRFWNLSSRHWQAQDHVLDAWVFTQGILLTR